MTKRDLPLVLYGVVHTATARDIMAAANRLPHPAIDAICALDLAAIVGPARPARSPILALFGGHKRALANDIVAFQRVLEAIHVFGPVIPAAFDTRLQDAPEALGLLTAEASRLRGALADHGPASEYRVAVEWDPEAMLRRLRDEPVLAPVRMAAVDGPVAVGRAVRDVMETLRVDLARRFAAILAPVATDSLSLPPEGERGILNHTVLIAPQRAQAFEAALAEIDAVAPEALKVRVIGPLPACSFASIRLERPDAGEIDRARTRLGLRAPVSDGRIVRSAWIDAMKRVHPDVAPHAAEGEAAETTEAYRLLARVADVEASGAFAGRPVTLVRFARADGAAQAA